MRKIIIFSIFHFLFFSLAFAQPRPPQFIGGFFGNLLLQKPDLRPPKVEEDVPSAPQPVQSGSEQIVAYKFNPADCKPVRPRFRFRATHYICKDKQGNEFTISVAEYTGMMAALRANAKIIFSHEPSSEKYPGGRIISEEPQKQSNIQPNLNLDQNRVGPFEGFFYFDPARRGNEKAFYMVISRMNAAIQNDTDRKFLNFDISKHTIPDENGRPMVDEITSKVFMKIGDRFRPVIIYSAGLRELGAGAVSGSAGTSQITGLPFTFENSFTFGIMINIPLSKEAWKKIGRGDLSPFFDFNTEFVRGTIFVKPNGKNKADDIVLQLDVNQDGQPDDFVIVFKHHGTGKTYNNVSYYVYGVGGDWQEVSQEEFKKQVDQSLTAPKPTPTPPVSPPSSKSPPLNYHPLGE